MKNVNQIYNTHIHTYIIYIYNIYNNYNQLSISTSNRDQKKERKFIVKFIIRQRKVIKYHFEIRFKINAQLRANET